jgi:GlcNAc-P-P-Und epimerase
VPISPRSQSSPEFDPSNSSDTSAEAGSAILFGGSGFVGYHLSHILASRGYNVVICDLVPPRRDVGAQYHYCDVRGPITLEVRNPQLVVNLAAVHRTPGHDDYEYYETNVRGALNVAHWCSEREVRDLVFTSSISVYGPSEELLIETSPLAPTTAYGRSKLIAEEIHQRWVEQQGGRLIVVRPAVIFGTHEQGNFTRLANALRNRRFAYPGRRDTVKSCGYVKDLGQALLFALGTTGNQLFNFCYKERYTTEQICETFHEVAGYPLPKGVPNHLVWGLIKALPSGDWARDRGFHSDRIQKLITSTNIYPKHLVDAGFQWPTDLRTAILDWKRDEVGGRGFV